MSSNSTPKMDLHSWVGSDNFLRTEFNENFNAIDDAPGAYICTFSPNTRPTWTSGQAGRLIFETDTRRLLTWDGTNFVETLSAPRIWLKNSAPDTGVNTNTNFDYPAVTIARPTSLALICVVTLATQGSDQYSRGTITPRVNSATVTSQSSNFPSNEIQQLSPSVPDHQTLTAVGFTSNVSGNVTFGVNVASTGPNYITVEKIQILAISGSTSEAGT